MAELFAAYQLRSAALKHWSRNIFICHLIKVEEAVCLFVSSISTKLLKVLLLDLLSDILVGIVCSFEALRFLLFWSSSEQALKASVLSKENFDFS